MKNRWLILTLILCLVAVLALPVYAAPELLVDDADLLSPGEEAQVEAELSRISGKYGMDIVIVTVDSIGWQSPMAYADDYYDYNGYGADGILLLVSMEEGDWWVSTTGYGITVITDAGLEYMSQRFVPYFSDGEFAQGFMKFAELCEAFLIQAETGDPYDSHNLPKDPYDLSTNLIVAVVIGLVAAWIVTGMMKSKLKTVTQQARADDYMIPGSLQLTHSRDLFLYTHIDRREKPKESSGSSTHTSSSGTRHGGGGGKF